MNIRERMIAEAIEGKENRKEAFKRIGAGLLTAENAFKAQIEGDPIPAEELESTIEFLVHCRDLVVSLMAAEE